MGVPFHTSVDVTSTAGSRKAQALAFITSQLIFSGHSPSIVEIAGALKVSKTRAKALVHQLATDKMIERTPGAQRAIRVPGLERQRAIEQLRADGYRVDEDLLQLAPPAPFPQGHLPLVAIIAHVPDANDGENHAEAPDA